MINLDEITNEIHTTHNPKYSYIPDHPHQILSYQEDINKIYLYARDLNQPKYQLFINKRKESIIKQYNDPRVFIKYSNTTDDRNREILIVFNDMVFEMIGNRMIDWIFTELFIRGRKLSISLVFIT